MTNVVALANDRAPRKRDAEATRAAILAAAKEHFARSGYDGTFLRGIAADAGVDAALINRYFGGKDGLFQAALKDSIAPDAISQWSRESFAHDVATMMAGHAHQHAERAHSFQFLLRAATSPVTAPLLNVAVQERFMGPIRDWIGGEDAEARARVLASVFIGLLVERLIRDEPLAGREREVFIERTAAVLQSLVEK
ncbi:MAG: TetR family transcriptional regulator [Alphaproteobacteria bacterium]|nr:TetR family transcriptional regulator [Alphaproteobacteria bacterium]MBL6937983.1 TetR family transcriptional regulator [Alphaproteobacteria bacterium]MBL7099192.1 TetR family transcriptional regulator [Alphaproteobacteria bacterium]